MKRKGRTTWVAWTDTEIQRLEQLVSEGRTASEIAKVLGRTYASITSRKEILGLKTPKRFQRDCPKAVAELVKFKMAGWNLEQIGKVVELHHSDISKILCGNGFRNLPRVSRRLSAYRHWDEIEVATLRKMLVKGISLEQIYLKMPYRTPDAIRAKAHKITRYWISVEEQAKLRRMKRKQLRVY